MVTTLVYSDSQPANPATIPILSPDTHIRGTFPHFDRVGVFSINTSLGLQNLDIDTAAPGLPYSDVMPGEYELGRDAVDSGIQVYNSGNYGVLYKFLIQLQSVTPFASTPLGILMQPTGGAGSYVMAVNGNKMLSPYVDYTSAWLFYGIHSSSKAAAIQLETSLTGGSAGPQRLYFAPNFKAQ